jgi:sodium transport system permease protein
VKRCLAVARKELTDHARDRRAVLSTVLYALMGPVVVLLVSLSRSQAGREQAAVLLSMASVFTLVSAFSGGMNVALDVVAGERERRSLVPLLLTPVRRLDVVVGKWIAASVFAVVSVAVTVVAFLLVLVPGLASANGSLAGPLTSWTVGGLTTLACFGSAINLLIAASSRSLKEAQGWTSMVAFIPMLIGMMIVFFPGWAGRTWFTTPVVGQQWLMVQGITGTPVSGVHAGLLVAVTIAAVVPALWLAGRALGRDDVLSS